MSDAIIICHILGGGGRNVCACMDTLANFSSIRSIYSEEYDCATNKPPSWHTII